MIYQQHPMISSDSLTGARTSHQQLRAPCTCICQEMMSRVDAHEASQTRVSEIESHAYHAMHDKDLIEGMQEYLAALVACCSAYLLREDPAMCSVKHDPLSLEHPRQSLLLSMQHQLNLWSLIKAPCSISFRQADLYAIFHARYVPAFSGLPCNLQILHVSCSAALRLSKALCYQGGLRFLMLDE